ncbi:MAG: S-layer homology domain-containing protein [Candidatus Gracilibacteria bacterium]
MHIKKPFLLLIAAVIIAATVIISMFMSGALFQSSLLVDEPAPSIGTYEAFQRYNTTAYKDHWTETFSGAVIRSYSGATLKTLPMSELAWGYSLKLPGYMEMFKTYKNTAYLDQLIGVFEEFLQNENFNDKDNDGRRDWMTTLPDDYAYEKLSNNTFWDYDTPQNKTVLYDFEDTLKSAGQETVSMDYKSNAANKAVKVTKSTPKRIALTNIVPGAYHVISFIGKSNGKPDLEGFATVVSNPSKDGETFTKITSHWPPVRSPEWETRYIAFKAPGTTAEPIPLFLELSISEKGTEDAESYFDNIKVGSVANYPAALSQSDRAIPIFWEIFTGEGSTSSSVSVKRNYANTGAQNPLYGSGVILKNNGSGLVGLRQELMYYSPKKTYELAYLAQTSSADDIGVVRVKDATTNMILAESEFQNTIPDIKSEYDPKANIDGSCTGKFISYKNFKKMTMTMSEEDSHRIVVEIVNKDPSKSSTIGINCISMRQVAPYAEHAGQIMMPIAEFILEVKQNPSLSKYKDVAKKYEDIILKEILPTYEAHIRAIPGTDKLVEYYHSKDFQGVDYYADEVSTSHNKFMPMMRTFLTMSKVTGNVKYKDLAIGLSKTFKSVLKLKEKNTKEYYIWNLMDNIQPHDNHYSNVVEDFSHANLTLGGVFEMFEHGLVYTKKDMQRFINTFFEATYNPAITVPCVSGGKQLTKRAITHYVDGLAHNNNETPYDLSCSAPIWQWIRIAAYDVRMWDVFKGAYTKSTTAKDLQTLGYMAEWDNAKIRNNSFSYEDVYSDGASHWAQTGSGGTILRTTNAQEIVSLPAALMVSKNALNQNIGVTQTILATTPSQAQYHLYFHSKNTSGIKGRVTVTTQTGALLLEKEINTVTWTPQGYAIAVPSKATSLKVTFEIQSSLQEGTMLLDDIYLFPKEGPVAITYVPYVENSNQNISNTNTTPVVNVNSNTISVENANKNLNENTVVITNTNTSNQKVISGYTGGSSSSGGTYIPAPAAIENPSQNMTSKPSAPIFTDIGQHFSKDAVNYLSAKGIIKGRTSTLFVPNGQLNRSEAAALIVRALEKEEESTEFLKSFINKNPSFSYIRFMDVPTNSWFAPAVGYLSDIGIIKGRSATEYASSESITRAEFIKLLLTFEIPLQSAEFGDAPFTDIKSTDWYFSYINDAYRKGVIMKSQTFRPNAPITRGEAASALERVLKNM